MSVISGVEAPPAVQVAPGAIFVSLELSQSKWLITSLSPADGEKYSKVTVVARDITGLHARFDFLRQKAMARTGRAFPLICIHEAGLDGFWLHRHLEAEGIESHVVDAASISVSRRRRRVKTDRIDPRLRTAIVQLAWLWVRHQPTSELTIWFKNRIVQNEGRLKKRMIVALARKLLVALWKYVSNGVVMEGAVMRVA